MTASIRGSASTGLSTDTSSPYEMTVTLPTHQTGDLLLIFLVFDRGDIDPTGTPSGWTYVLNKNSGALRYRSGIYLYKKTAASASETNPTFTLDQECEDSYKYCALAIQDHNDIDVTDTDSSNSASQSDMDAPSVTTTEDDCLVLRVLGHRGGSGKSITATPSTEVWLNDGLDSDDGNRPGHAGSEEIQASAGATGAATFTGTFFRPVTVTVAIKTQTTTTYELSASDGVNIGDTDSEDMTASPTATDGIDSGDIGSEGSAMSLNASDGITKGDLAIAVTMLYLSLLDGVNLGELSSEEMEASPSATDGIEKSDIATEEMTAQANATDGIELSDLALAALMYYLSVLDGLDLGDLSSEEMETDTQVTDSIKVGDLAKRYQAFYLVVSDGVNLGDSNLYGIGIAYRPGNINYPKHHKRSKVFVKKLDRVFGKGINVRSKKDTGKS